MGQTTMSAKKKEEKNYLSWLKFLFLIPSLCSSPTTHDQTSTVGWRRKKNVNYVFLILHGNIDFLFTKKKIMKTATRQLNYKLKNIWYDLKLLTNQTRVWWNDCKSLEYSINTFIHKQTEKKLFIQSQKSLFLITNFSSLWNKSKTWKVVIIKI